MINDLDETIRKLILTHGRFDADSVSITFEPPTGTWAAGLTRPTINCYLYDIRENLELRSAEWLVERQANGQSTKRLAPRRYSLSYLITIWTQNQVEDEHAILWRVLATLASHPALPLELCQGALTQQPYPILTQTAQPSVAIQNMPDLWGVLENQLRPSLDYIVTLAMEREVTFTAPLVFTKRVAVQQPGQPAASADVLMQIAGIVQRRTDAAPLPEAEVTLVETGRSVRSDRFGRYTFARVGPGSYHVRVLVDGQRTEHILIVPAPDHDTAHYDLLV